MLEKDEALKPANMATGRLGGRYVGRNRKWQGIPSLTRTRGGRLYVCFYSGGEGEGAENYVLLKKSDDDGKTWSEPVLAIDPAGNVRAFDPCLWTAPDGRVFLFWAQSYGCLLYTSSLSIGAANPSAPAVPGDCIQPRAEKPCLGYRFAPDDRKTLFEDFIILIRNVK